MNIKSTTILAVKRDGNITVAGDGQVTLETTILKHGARKVRRLYNNEVIVGFAGATADAFTLFADGMGVAVDVDASNPQATEVYTTIELEKLK